MPAFAGCLESLAHGDGRTLQITRGVEMEKDNTATRMLTVREVCQLLNVHSNTLRRWCRQGLVRSYRATARSQRRFRPEDVAALLKEQPEGPGGRSR